MIPPQKFARCRVSLATIALALLAGCATGPDRTRSDEGARLIAEGRLEEGLALMEQNVKAHPRDRELYTEYQVQRNSTVHLLMRDADRMRSLDNLDAAEADYRIILRIDPQSDQGRSGLDAVSRARVQNSRMREGQAALQAGDLVRAEQVARLVLSEEPNNRDARALAKAVTARQPDDATPARLREAFKRPVTLELRDAPLATIFSILSKTAEVNFVLDRDVKSDARTSIFVRDCSIEDVLKILLMTNQLNRKVLNDNSLLIYPATQAKQREHQELVMRSFYVANAEAKQTAAMIKAMVKTKDIFVDDKLNLVIMRDTPEAVHLAEQLVATQDLGEPEVMLDLEVLEVSSSLAQTLGVEYPTSIGVYGTDAAGVIADQVQLNGDGKTTKLRAFTSNPLMLLNLSKTDGSSNILANPRIRVKNREKAHVHIGERVPVITTTSTANVGVSSSVNYLETGLKLDVEPNVFLDQDVAIKVELEVSNILEQLNVSGTVAYRLGTRNAATTLRLRDGETQVLAGLIDNEDRKNNTGVPGASDLPMLGRLFRNEGTNGAKSEIVLLVTPHIVRNVMRSELVRAQFPAGTDAVPGAAPLRVGRMNRLEISAGGDAPTLAPAKPGAAAASQQALEVAVSAPPEVKVGDTVTLDLKLPEGTTAATAKVQVNYDPAVLKPVGAAPEAGAEQGQLTVGLSTSGIAGGEPPRPASVRFQVLSKKPTSTDIDMLVVESNARVSVPRTFSLSVIQ
ncbi:secretin N-terminal domain-containing protein [Variovorax sp.]|uniref:secretin N-terminal domain-containing protein n=1 Tax=Variovorax sp. TaxID=1871043 RepID=UPI002D364417|nr:secretin N-terminal domain-containing protein [Variovorax sp.]HYP85383.1 secretin N-terminal domain-containing protein [Variovorax sp.]